MKKHNLSFKPVAILLSGVFVGMAFLASADNAPATSPSPSASPSMPAPSGSPSPAPSITPSGGGGGK